MGQKRHIYSGTCSAQRHKKRKNIQFGRSAVQQDQTFADYPILHILWALPIHCCCTTTSRNAKKLHRYTFGSVLHIGDLHCNSCSMVLFTIFLLSLDMFYLWRRQQNRHPRENLQVNTYSSRPSCDGIVFGHYNCRSFGFMDLNFAHRHFHYYANSFHLQRF